MTTLYDSAGGLAAWSAITSDTGRRVSRGYEQMAEMMALSRLLRGRQYGHAVDIGGGYGHIAVTLREHADRVTVADSSICQVDLAQRQLSGCDGVEVRLMDAAHLDFDDASVDLAVMLRVLHNLPDPADTLAEIARVLKPGGHAVIGAANVLHAASRLRYRRSSQALTESPAEVRPRRRRQPGAVPVISHHPERLMLQLAVCGLQVERMLSVANLRQLRRLMPGRLMLMAESALQVALAPAYFGPSLCFLARKQDLTGNAAVLRPAAALPPAAFRAPAAVLAPAAAPAQGYAGELWHEHEGAGPWEA